MNLLRSIALLWALTGCALLGTERAEDDNGASSGSGGNAGSQGSGAAMGSGATASGGSSSGGTSGSSGSGASSGIGNAGSSGAAGGLGDTFRFGVNMNHRNWSWGDDQLGWLSSQAGCNSARVKLPEYHLEQWGYDIEVGDMQSYAGSGLNNLFAFLIGPTVAHSTAPAGAADWELDYYIPQNLYQPIFTDSGEVNPQNYWASYVHRTVTQYKGWVRIWEVWNEPDWVDDWGLTLEWEERAPTASDLTRFRGSVFDYIRMLRITKEVVKKDDPTALVALGGLGYSTFFDAVLRYTDNPTDGSVSGDYPSKGDAYFDVLNLHFYPLGTPSSDRAVDDMLELRDRFQAVANKYGVTGKLWHLTESGASHEAVSGELGQAFASNYLIKLMTIAGSQGFFGVDWFALSDDAPMGSSSDPYDFMGLYFDVENVATKEQAQRTTTGTAYRTLGTLLKGARYDGARTQALAIPSAARGAAFQRPDGKNAYALWARSDSGEQAATSVTLPIDGSFAAHAWDSSLTGSSSVVQSSGGSLSIMLSGSPIILVPN